MPGATEVRRTWGKTSSLKFSTMVWNAVLRLHKSHHRGKPVRLPPKLESPHRRVRLEPWAAEKPGPGAGTPSHLVQIFAAIYPGRLLLISHKCPDRPIMPEYQASLLFLISEKACLRTCHCNIALIIPDFVTFIVW